MLSRAGGSHRPVFFASYLLAELRRRSGRTVVTALGLAIGVGLVVTVSALSTGLATDVAKRAGRTVRMRDGKVESDGLVVASAS